jgi:quercetin dioxygenase-like cupin family protein
MHKTQSVDYGIMLEGERLLVLDDSETLLDPGDVVVQVGAWHLWDSARVGCLMAFDMICAEFVDGADGVDQTATGSAVDLPTDSSQQAGQPQRRVVTIDREPGRSSLVADGPSIDVRLDPARPGYELHRMWVTDSAPARIASESLHLPFVLEPPANGSVFNVLRIPPDASWLDSVGSDDVQQWYESIGSSASTSGPDSPHPYMQRTRTVDFCFLLEGELDLVLDTETVRLGQGDVVIQRGTNHAWSNKSARPARVAVISHDAK